MRTPRTVPSGAALAVIALGSLVSSTACRDDRYERSLGAPPPRLSVSLNEVASGSQAFILHVGVVSARADELVNLTSSGGIALSFAGAPASPTLCSTAAADQVFQVFSTPKATTISVTLGSSQVRPDAGIDPRACSELSGFKVEESILVAIPPLASVSPLDGAADVGGPADAAGRDGAGEDGGADAGPADAGHDGQSPDGGQNDAGQDGGQDR